MNPSQFSFSPVIEIFDNNANELKWILQHPDTYTAGVRSNKKEILAGIIIYNQNRYNGR